MNFAFLQVIFCILVFNNTILVDAGVKGNLRSTEISKALRAVKFNGSPWYQANPTRTISDGFGLDASTKSTFPIDVSKAVAGVVSRTSQGTEILVALFCRLMKRQLVAIWITRDQTVEEVTTSDKIMLAGTIPMPSTSIAATAAASLEKELKSPERLQFNALLEVLRKAGAEIYQKGGKNDNA